MEYHRCTVPVLFLVFNRPAHARAALARLRDVQPSRLYVHCDGPRPGNAQDQEKVQSVRMLIEQEIDWPCEVFTLFRDENAGLRKGVFGAISWFFEAEEKGDIRDTESEALSITRQFAAQLPAIRLLLDSDIQAAYEGDPAALSIDEVLVCYPGITAIIHYRLAHELHKLGVPLIARMIS